MDPGPDRHDLARQIVRLEERMETKQAEYRTDIARLAETMANWKTDMAQRDKDNLRWSIGLWVAAVVIIGGRIRWPVS
ncbi:MAG: hypothetical protein OXC91_07950, partial [Rhodobacteraceae bacterium]|nr:hypothetical protein [Paracoccaceae bacterium]